MRALEKLKRQIQQAKAAPLLQKAALAEAAIDTAAAVLDDQETRLVRIERHLGTAQGGGNG